MTKTVHGWLVIKSDGTPYHNKTTGVAAFFEARSLAQLLARNLDGARAVPCTLTYEI